MHLPTIGDIKWDCLWPCLSDSKPRVGAVDELAPPSLLCNPKSKWDKLSLQNRVSPFICPIILIHEVPPNRAALAQQSKETFFYFSEDFLAEIADYFHINNENTSI